MRATDRLLPAAALCVAGLLAGACGAEDADAGSEAADYLADQADLLADRIAADRPCDAIEGGERLVERTWATVSNGELPTATAAHVEEVVTGIVDQLVCEEPEDREAEGDEADGAGAQEPDPSEAPDATDEGGGPEERDGPRGDGDSGGGPEGDSEAAQGPDGSSTSGRGTDPPGQGEGRGRDEAPGQGRGGPPAGRGGGR